MGRLLDARSSPSGPVFSLVSQEIVQAVDGPPQNNTLTREQHAGTLITHNFSSGGGVYVTTDEVGGWQIGDTFSVVQLGPGTVSVMPDTGIQILPGSPNLTQYEIAHFVKLAPNGWIRY